MTNTIPIILLSTVLFTNSDGLVNCGPLTNSDGKIDRIRMKCSQDYYIYQGYVLGFKDGTNSVALQTNWVFKTNYTK